MLERLPGVRARRALLGPGLEPVDDVWMTFQGGVVSDLGTGRPPSPLPLLDGEVAMPGLVDCHVHLTMDGGPDVESAIAALDHDAALALARSNAAAQIRSGVTTVRDLGSFDHLLLGGPDLGGDATPSIVAAGAVSTPGGHGHFIASLAEGVEGYATATRALVDRGARAVKVFATGGVVTPGSDPGGVQMTPEELAAVVQVAHGCGVPVAAHAHGAVGIGNALRAGVDSIEHFSYLEDVDLAALNGSGTVLVSTLVATERFVASPQRDQARPETLAKILDHVAHERAGLDRAVAAGLRLAVGTDAGTTFNPHGGGMQEQAQHLAAAGLPNAEILRLLTREGALLLREPAGWLDVGRRGDLLCLGADPVADVSALADIAAVVTCGEVAHETGGGR